MSDLRIALVAEGPTDQIIIEAALRAILPNPFVLTLLHPEPTRPEMGKGWGGVFKWCRKFQQSGYARLEEDPTLSRFDLFIIHLDADVAEKSYGNYGPEAVAMAANMPALPFSTPCPPPTDTTRRLESILLAWLGIQHAGDNTVFCIPSKASEAWLASALFGNNHALLNGIECNLNLETNLAQLPKAHRVKKGVSEYRQHASTVTLQWDKVRQLCQQAEFFHQNVIASAPGT